MVWIPFLDYVLIQKYFIHHYKLCLKKLTLLTATRFSNVVKSEFKFRKCMFFFLDSVYGKQYNLCFSDSKGRMIKKIFHLPV